MKKKTDTQHAFSDLGFVIGLIASVGGVILAVLASGALSNAFAQAQRTKSAANLTQTDGTKGRFQVVGQNFWMQTNGPQGRRRHRISEKLDWPRICRDAGRWRFSLD